MTTFEVFKRPSPGRAPNPAAITIRSSRDLTLNLEALRMLLGPDERWRPTTHSTVHTGPLSLYTDTSNGALSLGLRVDDQGDTILTITARNRGRLNIADVLEHLNHPISRATYRAVLIDDGNEHPLVAIDLRHPLDGVDTDRVGNDPVRRFSMRLVADLDAGWHVQLGGDTTITLNGAPRYDTDDRVLVLPTTAGAVRLNSGERIRHILAAPPAP